MGNELCHISYNNRQLIQLDEKFYWVTPESKTEVHVDKKEVFENEYFPYFKPSLHGRAGSLRSEWNVVNGKEIVYMYNRIFCNRIGFKLQKQMVYTISYASQWKKVIYVENYRDDGFGIQEPI